MKVAYFLAGSTPDMLRCSKYLIGSQVLWFGYLERKKFKVILFGEVSFPRSQVKALKIQVSVLFLDMIETGSFYDLTQIGTRFDLHCDPTPGHRMQPAIGLPRN